MDYLSVGAWVCLIAQFEHDKQVLQPLFAAGKIQVPQRVLDSEATVINEITDKATLLEVADLVALRKGVVIDDLEVVDSLTGYEPGLAEESLASDLYRIRCLSDILHNSVRDSFGKVAEVTTWVNSLGGYQKVQERLCGVRLGRNSWYRRTCRALADELGADVPGLGEPLTVLVDSATDHSGYAVEAHRRAITVRQHGVLYEEEDQNSDPDWAQIETEPRYVPPFWRAKARLGRFLRKRPKAATLRQVDAAPYTGSFRWRVDLRISHEVGGFPFTQITDYGPWCVVEERPYVRRFMSLFYNDPGRLTWVKAGREGQERWCCGIILPDDRWLYAPVSGAFSRYLDWQQSKQGVPYAPKPRKAIYLGQFVILAKKVNDDSIAYVVIQQCNQTGLWACLKKNVVHWMEWAKMRKDALKKGAFEAPFGYPWREMPKFEQQ